MINFLILTHNRPLQFEKCLESVLNVIEKNNLEYKIIINNSSTKEHLDRYKDYEDCEDSNLNIEIYYKSIDVNDIYPFLYSKVERGYIQFVEDDDILLDSVYNDYENYNLYIGIYEAFDPKKTVYQIKEQSFNKLNNLKKFNYFQLSQMIFKYDKKLKFPTSYHHENDEFILNQLLSSIEEDKIKLIIKHFFKQGCYGDNLSYEEITCSDIPKL